MQVINRVKSMALREIGFLKEELKQLGEFVKLYARRANEELKGQGIKVNSALEQFSNLEIKTEVQISETRDDRERL